MTIEATRKVPTAAGPRLEAVPFNKVRIADAFWTPRLDANRTVTLPHQYRMCKETGRLDAFKLAWKTGMPDPPHIFWDSDVGKWLEAVGYSLATHPDPALERRADEVIAWIAGAQQPDGYLNTHFTTVEPEKRWTNLENWHELYCAGHLMEGAVAYAAATGKRTFLDVMCRYADVIERALYNGILSGVSLDGTRYFYANPLASAGPAPGEVTGGMPGGGHTAGRVEWFGCACCPPNLARLLASLGQYVYSTAPRAAYVHLYASGEAAIEVDSQAVRLAQKTDYPWSGDVRIDVSPARPAAFDLMLRVPGWCGRHAIRVNGKPTAAPLVRGYARLRRRWRAGDTVTLTLAMPVERIVAHPRVREDAGKVALMRGPLVYGLEECDNPCVGALVLPRTAKLTARHDRRLLGGVTVIEGEARLLEEKGWHGRLYAPAKAQTTRRVRFRAIPYFAWANRKPGAMTVWLPRVAAP